LGGFAGTVEPFESDEKTARHAVSLSLLESPVEQADT
jgi:hypothetical protein